MYLTSRVVFNLSTKMLVENYTPNGRFVGAHPYDTTVANMDEFRDFIKSFACAVTQGNRYIDKMTYLIDVQRKVIISDQDDRVYFKSVTFANKPVRFILSASGELLYAAGIEALLRKKNPDFYMKNKKFIDSRPIYLNSFDGHDVEYRPLVQNDLHNDIVIDSNLNQIWPDATGTPPIELVKLLSNTTEKVR